MSAMIESDTRYPGAPIPVSPGEPHIGVLIDACLNAKLPSELMHAVSAVYARGQADGLAIAQRIVGGKL